MPLIVSLPGFKVSFVLLMSLKMFFCGYSDKNGTALLNTTFDGDTESHSMNVTVQAYIHNFLNESQSSLAPLPRESPTESVPVPVLVPEFVTDTDFQDSFSEHSHCPYCLPEFRSGAYLHQSMTEWNNLVCDNHVCNASLDKARCGIAECAECYCDEDCVHYGDCCLDIFFTKAPEEPITEFACVSEAFIQEKDSSPKRYLMVGSCPEESLAEDGSVKDMCISVDPLDLEGNTPMYSDATGLHYRNRYCAQCNELSGGTAWSVESSCQSYVDYSTVSTLDELLDLLREEDHCHVHFTPPKLSTARRCSQIKGLISTCNATGQWMVENYDSDIELACGLFTQETNLGNNITYKNPFCAYCNGENLYKKVYCPGSIDGVPPFSVLFNFRRNEGPHDTPKSEDAVKCRTDEVYDSIKKTCRRLFCPRGKYPALHSCENFVDSAIGIGYILRYALKPRNAPFAIVSSGIDEFLYSIKTHLLRIIRSWTIVDFSLMDMKAQYSVANIGGDKTVNKVRSIDIQFAMLVGGLIPRDELEKVAVDYVKRGWWFYDTEYETDVITPIYFDSVWLTSFHNDRLDYVASPMINIGLLGNETIIEVNSVYRDRDWRKSVPANFLHNTSVYILVNELMQCNIIELNQTEYDERTSGDIVVLFSGEILSPGQFTKNGERVRVCTNFSGQPRNQTSGVNTKIFDYTEVIITIVCTSLSLTGLAITVIVYLLNPSLLTLPGKNNMMLFINLFIAQLMFLCGAAAKVSIPVCQTFGVIIHYFWLSSFCWKSVCAIHMFRIFTNPLKILRQFRSFCMYVVFAQVLPLVIIAVYIIIHYALSNKASIGYADRAIGEGEKLCFLSTSLDVALGFVLPVGLVILINALLFSRVVYALRTRPDIPRHSAKSNINETVIYLKMSVLLGFTWGLGFVALIGNVQGLWYVFTLMNASIGIFVFLSFGLRMVSIRKWLGGKTTNSTYENSKTTETKFG